MSVLMLAPPWAGWAFYTATLLVVVAVTADWWWTR